MLLCKKIAQNNLVSNDFLLAILGQGFGLGILVPLWLKILMVVERRNCVFLFV